MASGSRGCALSRDGEEGHADGQRRRTNRGYLPRTSLSSEILLAIYANTALGDRQARQKLQQKAVSDRKIRQDPSACSRVHFLVVGAEAKYGRLTEEHREITGPPWTMDGAHPADVPPSFLDVQVDRLWALLGGAGSEVESLRHWGEQR
jgi:hypothetical protein